MHSFMDLYRSHHWRFSSSTRVSTHHAFDSYVLLTGVAHHCNNNHPYNRIMKEFYWQCKTMGQPVPHILGLTASPVVRSDTSSLEKLETTLNAVCRSPTKHREELLAHTQRPFLIPITFEPKTLLTSAEYTESMEKLVAARNGLNIMEDPYVVFLKAEKTDRSRRRLIEAITKKSTYVQNSMRTFCRRSVEIAKDLGIYAADWYIFETIRRFLDGIPRQGAVSVSFRDAEVVYLACIFKSVQIGPPRPMCEQSGLTDKVQQLVEVLLKYDHDARGISEYLSTPGFIVSLFCHSKENMRYTTGPNTMFEEVLHSPNFKFRSLTNLWSRDC